MNINKFTRDEFNNLSEKQNEFYEIFEGNNKSSYYYNQFKLPFSLGKEIAKDIGIQHLYICTEEKFDSLKEKEKDNSSVYLIIGDRIKMVYGGISFLMEGEDINYENIYQLF